MLDAASRVPNSVDRDGAQEFAFLTSFQGILLALVCVLGTTGSFARGQEWGWWVDISLGLPGTSSGENSSPSSCRFPTVFKGQDSEIRHSSRTVGHTPPQVPPPYPVLVSAGSWVCGHQPGSAGLAESGCDCWHSGWGQLGMETARGSREGGRVRPGWGRSTEPGVCQPGFLRA